MKQTKDTILEEWLNEAQKAECESQISDAPKARAGYLNAVGDREHLFMFVKFRLEVVN